MKVQDERNDCEMKKDESVSVLIRLKTVYVLLMDVHG